MPAQATAWVRGVLALSPLLIFVAAAAGATLVPAGEHGLALLPGGQMAGWGANEFAQVQAGQGDFVQNPQRMSLPGTRARAVTTGSRHSLAVDETGRVWAWGDNSSGQLGLGHTRPSAGMALVTGLPGRASLIAAGAQHSMALMTDGTVWVWGANNRGQLGRGAVDAFAVQAKPVRVTALGRVVDVASGNDFVLALVGQRDRNGSTNGAAWVWGAGNGSPHMVDGLQSASVLRAAGDLAMARTTTGGYWQWRPEQTPPGIAQRTAFEKLGAVTHPLLAALSAPPAVDAPPRPVASTPVPTLATTPPAIAVVPQRIQIAPTPAAIPPTAPAPVVAAVPSAASPARPAPALPATVPVAVTPPAAPVAALPAPAPVPIATPPAAPAATLTLSGTVRLSAGFGGDNTGKVLENVQIVAEGAQCSATDSQGRYTCNVPAGWTGRVTLRRGNYRFSPNALSFQNLRVDAGQQDFAAIYDPR